jgi:hypothetical protein
LSRVSRGKSAQNEIILKWQIAAQKWNALRGGGSLMSSIHLPPWHGGESIWRKGSPAPSPHLPQKGLIERLTGLGHRFNPVRSWILMGD